jgi:MFS family permease
VQFSMNVFTLLWGVPYLVSAQGLSSGTAGALVTLFVACTITFGPVFGALTTSRPLRRSWLVLVVVALTATVWTAVLALPGPAPLWLLVLLIVVLGMGGPASVVGIDIGRTSNPTSSLGVAQAMVNLGGFSASLVVLAAMGVALDLAGGFTPHAFRLAWLVQYPVWAAAVVCLLLARRTARRDGPGDPVPAERERRSLEPREGTPRSLDQPRVRSGAGVASRSR